MSAARELARSLGAIYVGCRLPANDERLPRLVSEIDAALADARRESGGAIGATIGAELVAEPPAPIHPGANATDSLDEVAAGLEEE